MFSFFKKNSIDKKIPKEYTHLLTQQQYNDMLDIVMAYFRDKGEEVIKLEDGYITVRDENEKELKYGFDNLVRFVAGSEKKEWESVIYSHFNKVNFDDSPLVYYRKDYEAARPFLKMLVKDQLLLRQEFGKELVWTSHFPGTCSLLVFDYDNQFRYLKQEDIAEWNQPKDVLFEQAQTNVGDEEITVNKVEHEDGIEMFIFFSGDFSASFVADFDRNLSSINGEFGSLVAIPTKGTAFVSPLNDKNVLKRIELISEPVIKFFNEDPGNITTNLYWFYDGKFEQFPETPAKDGYVSISIPEELQLLLNKEEE